MNEHEHAPVGMEDQGDSNEQEQNNSPKNKLVLGLVGVVLLAVVAGAGYYYLANKEAPPTQQTEEVAQKEEDVGDKTVCTYDDDNAALYDAINNSNMDACFCVSDASKKESCKKSVSDALLYNNALSHMDITLCEEISAPEHVQACKDVITSSEGYFEESDPQRLAEIYMQGQNEKSVEQLEKLLEAEPDNVKNLSALALTYAEMGLHEQEKGGDQGPYTEKAIALINRAMELDGENSEVYRIAGYVQEIIPNYAQAIEYYNKAIELDPGNALAYAGRGHTERLTGGLSNAVESFNKAAELDVENKYPHIYANLCVLEFSRSSVEEAEKNCKIVINHKASKPSFKSEAYQVLSTIALDRDEYSQARSYLETALTVTPNNSNLYVSLSKLAIFEEDYDASETHARKAIEISPTKAIAHYALSQALYMQERYQESIAEAEKGLALVDEDVSLLEASKNAVKRDLYYMISFNYRELGDEAKQNEYVQLAEKIMSNSNQE